MDHRLDMSALEAEEDNSQLLIGASRDGIMNNIGGDGNSRSLGEIEMRGCTVPGIVMAAASGGLESTQDEMGGGTGGTRRLGGSAEVAKDMISGEMRMVTMIDRAIASRLLIGGVGCLHWQSRGPLNNVGLMQDNIGLLTGGPAGDDRDSLGLSDHCQIERSSRDIIGPVHNPAGLNLKIVLVGPNGFNIDIAEPVVEVGSKRTHSGSCGDR
ncbi:hypothetical protein Dimus_034636 [Dionaea muscipula]